MSSKLLHHVPGLDCEQRAAAWHKMQAALNAGKRNGGRLSDAEAREYDQAEREFDALTDEIELADAEAADARVGIVPRWNGDGTPIPGGGAAHSRTLDGPFLAREARMAGGSASAA